MSVVLTYFKLSFQLQRGKKLEPIEISGFSPDFGSEPRSETPEIPRIYLQAAGSLKLPFSLSYFKQTVLRAQKDLGAHLWTPNQFYLFLSSQKIFWYFSDYNSRIIDLL